MKKTFNINATNAYEVGAELSKLSYTNSDSSLIAVVYDEDGDKVLAILWRTPRKVYLVVNKSWSWPFKKVIDQLTLGFAPGKVMYLAGVQDCEEQPISPDIFFCSKFDMKFMDFYIEAGLLTSDDFRRALGAA